MRGTVAVGAVLAALAVGCTTTGTGHGESVSPPAPATPTSTGSPSPTATPSSAPDGPLETGGAAVTLSGDLTAQVALPTLAEPDVWSSPPGPMALTWDEPGGQSLTLSGASFTSRASTSGDRVLSFVVDGPEGPVGFSSSGGECVITITPALPDNMGGVFTCASLTDTTGTVTVEARGNFAATV
ncbi:MAG TPA: hypothetical protein VFM86_06530 [Pedococcus sp.]|nr:hypothetical protein [Pedococcus sp.]